MLQTPVSALLLAVYLLAIGGGLLLLLRHWHAGRGTGTAPVRAASDLTQADFFRIACESADDGILLQDLDATILWANPAYGRILQRPLDDMVGRNPLSFCLPPDQQLSDEDVAAFRYDPADPVWDTPQVFQNARPDGSLFWISLRVSFHRTQDGTTLAVLVCRDVSGEITQTERLREKSDELTHLAHHDALTGLANRAGLQAFLERRRARVTEAEAEAEGGPGGRLGVLQFDLDRFKYINDTFGHAAGDAVLQHVAQCARAHFRPTDVLARLGGDEFVAVCPGITDEAELIARGEAICAAINRPIRFDGQDILPAVSVGAVLAHEREGGFDELLRRSDFALYEVKRRGRGHTEIYDEALHDRFLAKARRSEETQAALRDGQITFWVQPTIMVATGQVRGFETLARWNHPAGGVVLPKRFLPILREMGLMADLDRRGFDACTDFKQRLNAAGFGAIRAGFNASPAFFDRPDVWDLVDSLPAAKGLHPAELVFELSENLVFRGEEGVEFLHTIPERLITKGFAVLLDDFGAGFAGLMHLGQLNVAGFKIARDLTRTLTTSAATRKTIGMVNEMAGDLGLYSVTVGVENAETVDILATLGGAVAQGNWMAPAMPPDEALAWLRRETRIQNGAHVLQRQLPLPRRAAI